MGARCYPICNRQPCQKLIIKRGDKVYVNPSNIIKSEIKILSLNATRINQTINTYQNGHKLTVLEGMRKTLPVDAFPSFEIEPGTGENEWGCTHAQRPRYNFTCTLTVMVSNPEYGAEYIQTLATILTEIMCDPQNLQFIILNETLWTPNGGLTTAKTIDSLVQNVTYSAVHDGSIRVAEFAWFAWIHEPFPESKFRIDDFTMPTVIRPKLITVP